MNKDRLLLFVDCNVLIESLLLPMHAATAIAILAANKHVDLVTCALVVEDVEKEILDRCSQANNLELIDAWTTFKQQIRLRVIPDPPLDLVKETRDKYLGIMRHQADIPVLASAIEIGPDLVLSDNTEHFNILVSERSGIPMWSCVEFIHNMVTGTIKEKLKGTK